MDGLNVKWYTEDVKKHFLATIHNPGLHKLSTMMNFIKEKKHMTCN